MSEATQETIAGGRAAVVIAPSIARNIWFYPAVDDGRHEDGQPFAAIVAGVNDDGTINLGVFARDGSPYGATNVRLVQEGEPIDHDAAHAAWMPYQRGQAPSSSAVEGRLQAIEKLLEEGGSVHKLITGMATQVGEQLGDVNKRVAALELATKGQTTAPKEPPPAPAPQGQPPLQGSGADPAQPQGSQGGEQQQQQQALA